MEIIHRQPKLAVTHSKIMRRAALDSSLRKLKVINKNCRVTVR